MDDLDRLIEAVEAGASGWNRLATIAEGVMPTREAQWAATAYYGDLNAAKFLHDALLPGWRKYIGEDEHSVTATVVSRHGEFSGDGAASMARAWLLAILKALKAKGAA